MSSCGKFMQHLKSCLLWQLKLTEFCANLWCFKLIERKKFGLICVRGLIYCDQEPLWLLNVIEDDCYFLGVHMRLSTRCKILFTLGLFANYFSLKSLSLSLKSHMNVLCALKLTELWNTSLLFDLNYKFINGSLAFSPG